MKDREELIKGYDRLIEKYDDLIGQCNGVVYGSIFGLLCILVIGLIALVFLEIK